MSCGVYKITNLINNKIYVGQSVEIENRWEAEKNRCINFHLKQSFKKYGIDNFKFEILVECSKEVLDEIEIWYIDYYKSYDIKYGYNKTLGGYNGAPNEETKKRISETVKKLHREGIYKNVIYGGKPISNEHKQAITEKISGEKNYQWVNRTQEMKDDVKKLTILEWRKKHNQSHNMYYRIKKEINYIRDDRKNCRKITKEMIEDSNILGKTKFRKKYQCSERFFYKIKKGEY